MDIAELRSLVRRMRDTGVETLDVRERQSHLRIRLDPAHRPPQADPAQRRPAAAARGAKRVRAEVAGTFLDAHPLRPGPLAVAGTRVAPGQLAGLLKTGVLYRPVLAPAGGTIARRLASPGAEVTRGAPLFEIRNEETT